MLLSVLIPSAAQTRPITINERLAEASLRRQGLHTIEERYEEYAGRVRTRLLPYFHVAGVTYPPAEIEIVAIKDSKRLELYAASDGPLRLIRTYPILAASGMLGPKLREGDRQVPEGIYRIEKLNPNSAYHLALRVAYPNQFDLDQARFDGRGDLGSNIMIHGGSKSAGCLAVGDQAIEDLFIVTAEVGAPQVTLVITPVDFRKTRTLPPGTRIYPWSSELYSAIERKLGQLPSADRGPRNF